MLRGLMASGTADGGGAALLIVRGTGVQAPDQARAGYS